jgi:hypothetical protein
MDTSLIVPAAELGPHNITVNSYAPGEYYTSASASVVVPYMSLESRRRNHRYEYVSFSAYLFRSIREPSLEQKGSLMHRCVYCSSGDPQVSWSGSGQVFRRGILSTPLLRELMSDAPATSNLCSQQATVPPLRRNGDPIEIAGLVSFLASNDSSYMTGQTVRHHSIAEPNKEFEDNATNCEPHRLPSMVEDISISDSQES